MIDNGGNKREEKKPYAKTNAKNGGSARKSYTKPTLTTYGTIRDLTKTVGGLGQVDGGSGIMVKTNGP
jgi:hypothetical protein